MNDLVLDHYDIGPLIDRTLLGRVFRGTHRSMGRPVKITIIDVDESTPRDSLLAYEERTRAASRIRHPAVPAILDFGRQGRRVYRIDELVEAPSLFELYADQGITDVPFLRQLFLAITEVLTETLDEGHLHLQCSPSCVRLLDPNDPTSVMIEGFASRPWGVSPGDPHYAAPEQFTEDTASAAADVYILGLLLWFCLLGTGPTLGSAQLARQAHLSSSPWRLPPLEIPADLEAMITRCLEKRPDRRFPSVRQLQEALRGDPPRDSMIPRPGTLFAGDYEVLHLLGEGGFGQVFAARDRHSHEPVALKIQRAPESARQGSEVQRRELRRFEREAQIVARLRCPYTVRLHAYGRTPQGLHFQVLEWVSGRPLSEVVQERGALQPPIVELIAHQLLLSLQEAHAFGILHRDIKPANIMLIERPGQQPEARLLDFGIARLFGDGPGEHEPPLTETGTAPGTPRYMSPEQLFGQPLTPRSDLFSLGLVLHELLTGAPAIQARNTYEIVAHHVQDHPLPPLPTKVGLPLRHLVTGLTCRDPSRRVGTATEALKILAAPAERDPH